MTPRHALMATGLVLAAALAWFGNRDAQSDAAEPLPRQAGRLSAPVPVPRPESAPARSAVADPELPLLTLLDRSAAITQGREGQGTDRIFATQAWAVPALPAAPAAAASEPPPAPTAPALPFSYIGRQTQGGQGGPVEVFLAQGDQVHLVHVHSLIDNTYRVDAISATTVSFTYLPLNSTQQLSIGSSD